MLISGSKWVGGVHHPEGTLYMRPGRRMKKHAERPERLGFLSGSGKSDRRRRRFVYILVAAVSPNFTQLSRLTKSMPGSAFVLTR